MEEKKRTALQKLGQKIKKYRKKKGMTQRDLGKKLGLTNNLVCMWEKGKQEPTGLTLIKLAKILNTKFA